MEQVTSGVVKSHFCGMDIACTKAICMAELLPHCSTRPGARLLAHGFTAMTPPV